MKYRKTFKVIYRSAKTGQLDHFPFTAYNHREVQALWNRKLGDIVLIKNY